MAFADAEEEATWLQAPDPIKAASADSDTCACSGCGINGACCGHGGNGPAAAGLTDSGTKGAEDEEGVDAEEAAPAEWRGRGQAAALSMRDIESLVPSPDDGKHEAHLPELRELLAKIVHCTEWREVEQCMLDFRRTHKFQPKKNVLWHLYQEQEHKNMMLEKLLVKKGVRSLSGVLVVTVLTSPYPEYDAMEKRRKPQFGERKVQRFSCRHNCYYCPNEPAHEGNNFVPQPRSYLHDEPGVLRANQNGFDAVKQFRDRIHTYLANGHPIDKIELLVLGGTWSEYPQQYQREFVRDLFYAANTTFSDRMRRLSLEEEVSFSRLA
ncbi:unnamed protein product [Phaeothamnion confervicola]